MPLPHRRLGRGSLLAIGGLVALAGCEEVTVITVEAASVEVSPEDVTVFQTQEEAVTAIVRSSAGAILSGRSLSWSIDDPEVAVVSAVGVLRGEQPGTTTVRVRTEGLEGTAPVTVLLQPEIDLSRTEVELRGVVGEGDPPAQEVEISNAGEGMLSGLSLSIEGDGDDVDWLSASLAAPVAPTTLVLSAATGSRPPGTYEGTVFVASPEAHNSPQEVQVTLQLDEPSPIIVLDPPSVSFGTISGSFEPATQSVAVTNGGGGTLRELSASVGYSAEPRGWLSARLQSGRAPTVLELEASARNLAPGTYRAEVEVSSPRVPGGSRTVEVIFQVSFGEVQSP